MVAINIRRAACAIVVLVCACLVAGAGAVLPLNETPAAPGLDAAAPVENVTAAPVPVAANATANATPVVTANATAVMTAAPLTLVLEPSTAVYGDVVQCTVGGGANATVRILVDGVEAGRAVPGGDGAQVLDYTVDRLPAGVHVVMAEAAPLRTAEAVLEVVAVDPVVLLEVAPAEWENQTALLCTGNVTAAGRPVPDAPVRLVFDDSGTADCTTGPEGQFELLAGVVGGSHRVVASVAFADGRPLNPASSAAVSAELPGGFSVLPVLAVIVVLLVGAGGFLFWRRGRSEPPAAAAPPVDEAPERTAPPPEDLRATARRLAGDGGRAGIEAVYRELAARLAKERPGAKLQTMTPRELAASFEGSPGGIAVARVAACYEAVVYSGRAPTPVDVETVVEGFVAALSETARAGP